MYPFYSNTVAKLMLIKTRIVKRQHVQLHNYSLKCWIKRNYSYMYMLSLYFGSMSKKQHDPHFSWNFPIAYRLLLGCDSPFPVEKKSNIFDNVLF